jgi:hypothetical protein
MCRTALKTRKRIVAPLSQRAAGRRWRE